MISTVTTNNNNQNNNQLNNLKRKNSKTAKIKNNKKLKDANNIKEEKSLNNDESDESTSSTNMTSSVSTSISTTSTTNNSTSTTTSSSNSLNYLNNKVNQTEIYESFWKLSEYNFNERIKAVKQLSEYFNLNNETPATTETSNKSIQNDYILNRLIKGLGSNRKCSRLGFSLALTEILNNTKLIELKDLLEIADRTLDTAKLNEQSTNNKQLALTKEETRHMQIGMAFVYLSFIQSNRLDSLINDDNKKTHNYNELQLIVKNVNQNRKNKELKFYVQRIYTQTLILLIKKFKLKWNLFLKKIWPLIEDDLSLSKISTNMNVSISPGSGGGGGGGGGSGGGNGNNGPNSLTECIKSDINLLMACLNTYPVELLDHLMKSDNKVKQRLSKLFSSENYSKLFELISQSTESLPAIQPFCVELIEYLTKQDDLTVFNDFWLNVIDDKLCTRKEAEKKYLSFRLYLVCVKCLNETNCKLLFNECLIKSNNILHSMLTNYLNRKSNLNKITREIVKELIDLIKVKEIELDSTQAAVGMSIGSQFLLKFFKLNQNWHELSDLFGSVIPLLNQHGLNNLLDYLINEFGHRNLVCDETSKSIKLVAKPNALSVHANHNGDNQDKRDEEIESQMGTETDKNIWIVNQIFNLSKNEISFKRENLSKKIFIYLLIESFFRPINFSNGSVSGNKSILDENEAKKNAQNLENHIQETLLKYLGVFFLKNDDFSLNSTIIYLVEYAHGLIETSDEFYSKKKSSKNGLTIVKQDDDDNRLILKEKLIKKSADFKLICAQVLDLLRSVDSNLTNRKPNEDGIKKVPSLNDPAVKSDVLQTFFMTVTLEFFRMFESFTNSKQTIQDIDICFKQFLKETTQSTKSAKSKAPKPGKDKNVVPWIDMIVEILLNLLTINKHWIRVTVKSQFKKLIPLLTIESVQLIIDLLGNDAENELTFENNSDEEGDDDDDDDDESESGQSSEDEKMDEEDSAEDNNKDKKEEQINAIKNDLKKLNGFSAGKVGGGEETNKKKLNNDLSLLATNGHNDDEPSDEEEESDLDDEQMMKFDDAIAAAFKARKSEKNQESEKLLYKLKVLDLIQEISKTSHRFDLVMYLIKPMLKILFESQKKPNLKSISQRILGLLVNFRNLTKKLEGVKLPEIDEIFETLSFVIECSKTHFNVINTLVETSMFCVKIILFLANNSLQSDKENIIKKLTNIYLDLIKTEKNKINPLVYREFITRFPEQATPLVAQIIENANGAEVKIHKKTSTLITLHQTINPRIFEKSNGEEQCNFLINKLCTFINQTMDEIIQNENLNIKYVDAFLNLTQKTFNMLKTQIEKEFYENLSTKLSQLLIKETKLKQAHKSRFSNLIQLCRIQINSQTNTS